MAAAATTTTTLTELVQAEIVEMSIKMYLIDAPVINPLCQYRNIAGAKTKAISFPLWVKDSGADITEGTDLTVEDLETTEVSVTVAQVGIWRKVTDFVSDTATIGAQGLYNAILRDGVLLCIEMLEDDLAALFASATGATVGTSGADFSVANFVEGIAKMRTIKARGQYVSVLDDQQALDFMMAVAASSAAVLGGGNIDQSVLNSGSDGVVGSFMNVPIFMTNLTDTANSGADVVGTMFVSAGSNEEHCPMSWAELWAPRVRQAVLPEGPSYSVSTTMAYGAASTHPAAQVKFVTDA